jgi:hypothetical protein
MIGRTVIVGFGYKARRGKDTACQAIFSEFAARAALYAFADELKVEVARYAWMQAPEGTPVEGWRLGLPKLCAWAGVAFVPGALKQRPLLQWFGEFRRQQDSMYWVKKVVGNIRANSPEFALISDVRYLNEFQLCDYAVRMDRPGFEIGDGAGHISEVQLDALKDEEWEYVISATDPEEVRFSALMVFRDVLDAEAKKAVAFS